MVSADKPSGLYPLGGKQIGGLDRLHKVGSMHYTVPMDTNIDENIALDALRAKVLGRPVATAIFTRTDGMQFTLSDVRVDSIGPSAEARGVVGVEFENDSDKIIHLPFIHSWQIEWSL